MVVYTTNADKAIFKDMFNDDVLKFNIILFQYMLN